MTLNTPINVAQVPKRSLFRYPGGKTWLIPILRKWLSHIQAKTILEPFAGSGVASLTAIAENYCEHAILVELDPNISAVWKTVLDIKKADWLANRILGYEFTTDNVYETLNSKPISTELRAFKTIIWNRATRGGIMAHGSGLVKNGENGKGISSRWYPATLAKRIEGIVKLQNRLEFIQGNAFDVINDHTTEKSTALFIDPPYTVAGRRLYQFNEIDHNQLFALAAKHKGDVLLTYDDSNEIRYLTSNNGFMWKKVAMQNTHLKKKYELLISKDFEWLEKE